MSLGSPLPRSFYERDSRVVAEALIGCRLVHRLADGTRLVARIVEVEAYLGDGSDPASHAHPGETARNRTMFDLPGRLYAYRSYGIHTCVNVVCEVPGRAGAVLLRAAQPLAGIDRMRALRGLAEREPERTIARGPGRLAQALGLSLADDGRSLLRSPLSIRAPAPGTAPVAVARGPRVGITKAAELPYRYFEEDSPWVSPFRPGKRRTRRT